MGKSLQIATPAHASAVVYLRPRIAVILKAYFLCGRALSGHEQFFTLVQLPGIAIVMSTTLLRI